VSVVAAVVVSGALAAGVAAACPELAEEAADCVVSVETGARFADAGSVDGFEAVWLLSAL
jgi:hypothetical protein